MNMELLQNTAACVAFFFLAFASGAVAHVFFPLKIEPRLPAKAVKRKTKKKKSRKS
jgi:hypothetical protein